MRRIADCVPFGDSIGNTDKSATLFTYNADGKLVKQTDPRGKEISYEFDLDVRVTETVDGNETCMEYDITLWATCSSCRRDESATSR